MLYDSRLKKVWKEIHCADRHFISRHDGMYSHGAEFIKDSIVILSEIWDIGKNYIYYENWASDEEKNEELNRLEMKG